MARSWLADHAELSIKFPHSRTARRRQDRSKLMRKVKRRMQAISKAQFQAMTKARPTVKRAFVRALRKRLSKWHSNKREVRLRRRMKGGQKKDWLHLARDKNKARVSEPR